MEVGYSFDVIENVGCYLSVNIQPCNLLPEGILVIFCAIEQNVTYIKDQFCLPYCDYKPPQSNFIKYQV